MKPRPLTPGKTFLDRLTEQMEFYSTDKTWYKFHQVYRYWLAAIHHADTRRILFDAEQASQFAPLIEFPEKWSQHVNVPFDSFYMEFSDPVKLGDAWAVSENDYLMGLLYGPPANQTMVEAGPLFPNVTKRAVANHLVLFFHDPITDTYTDRNFLVDVRSGKAYVTRWMAERTFEWRNAPSSELMASQMARDGVYGTAKAVFDDMIKQGGTAAFSPGDLEDMKRELMIPTDAHDKSTGLDGISEDRNVCFIAGDFAEDRNVGWWERQAIAGTTFLQWCLAYMMAKSIKIEVRDISRQQKRWLTRRNKPWPKPWHVIIVDPRYVRNLRESDGDERSYRHSYRYDVMGHPRLARHRIGPKNDDGSYAYRQILEWVPAHQRGLANEIYIPATRVIEAGRKVPKEIRTGRIESNDA